MGEEQKKQLEQQLWNIANTLRGKMDADEFRDYILGFIFYKYLSEKMDDFANDLLEEDNINIEIANHPLQIVKIKSDVKVEKYDIMRISFDIDNNKK